MTDITPEESRIIGVYYVRSGGGWIGTTTPPNPNPRNIRPYLGNTLEVSGPDRIATGLALAQRLPHGTFEDGAVFVARWEDISGAAVAAGLTKDASVVEVSRVDLLTEAGQGDQLVIVGGDGAISVQDRVTLARAFHGQ